MLVPIVGKDIVLINRDKAAFADVIAPYMLIQSTQQHSKKKADIHLHEEMKKCCLLRKVENDPRYHPRLLQGLIEVWRGNLQPERNAVADREDHNLPPKTDRKPQWFKAFPENLLHLVPEVENVEYTAIVGNDIMIGYTRRALPSLDGIMITFLLSTNLDKIRLHLSDSGDRTLSRRATLVL